MTCEYCEIIEGHGKAELLYQDEFVVVAIRDTGVTPGQITIFPKKHFTIMEMVPKEILERCAVISNKVGVAVFEGLGAQGTNILVQNGLGAGQKVPHFAIEVIPRQENDGLNLQWEPKQVPEDEMDLTFLTLKESIERGIETIEEKKEEVKEEPKEEKVDEKDNYLLKQLKRIP